MLKTMPTALIGLLLGTLPALASPPKPETDSQRYYLCPGYHGAPFLVGEKQLIQETLENPRLRNLCRKELFWRNDQRWLCRKKGTDFILFSDYPLDKIGIIPESESIFGDNRFENLSCETINLECKQEIYLILNKHCISPIDDQIDHWKTFADDANRPAQHPSKPCRIKNSSGSYPTTDIRTGCTREKCILTEEKQLLYRTWKIIERESFDFDDYELLRQIHFEALDKTVIQTINDSGLYCIKSKLRFPEQGPQLKDSREIENARLLKVLPQSAKSFPLKKPDSGPAATPFSCQTDQDCIQGKSGKTCMIRQMAKSANLARQQADPSYRCECKKGPVVFGCVPASK